MSFHGKVTLKTGSLKSLQRQVALAGKAEVRVGIFAEKTSRDEGGPLNNAEIGAVHELGSKSRNIPMRSFLRVPCLEDLPKTLAGKDGKALVKVMVATGTEAALENLGVMAEQAVDNAFTTSGRGRWPALKPATIRAKARRSAKGGDMPLFDTGKLAASITSSVVMGGKVQ